MLPASRAETTTVQLTGGPVEVRGLTIAEIRDARAYGQTIEGDAAWIHYATGNPVDHIVLWIKGDEARGVLPALGGDVTRLLFAIWEATGMTEDARFQSGTADDVGADGAGIGS